MDYDRLVLEMLNRISVIEDKVCRLETGQADKEELSSNDTRNVSKKYRFLTDFLYKNI